MKRGAKICVWALVFSVAGLSAAPAEPPREQENTFEEGGDEERDGLGGIEVASTPSKAESPSKEEAERRTDRFIQGAFCMITFILFAAGYVGTKAHKGQRVQ